MDILGLGIIVIADWFLLLCLLGVAAYVWLTWKFNTFKDQGIPGPKPYPLVGTMLPMFTEGIINMEQTRYKKYGRLYGSFHGRTPSFRVARDDLLSEILVKQFWNFPNRRSISDGSDLVESFLTVLKNDNWKRVRNLLTPTFSSGKLKLMVKQMNSCASQLTGNIETYAKNKESFELKDVTGCFAMDTIGATAFGLEVNSLHDRSNVFVKMAKKAVDFSVFSPVILLSMIAPFLMPWMKKLRLSMFSQDVMSFFEQITKEAVEQRKSSKDEGRTDFVQLMVNAHKLHLDSDAVKQEAEEFGATFDKTANEKGLKDVEILAQGILFFLAGFDTTSQAMTLLLYELAVNPDIQEKLHDSICEVLGSKEKVDYNDVSQMTYLDMCFNEALRKYPVAIFFDRSCEKDVTIKEVQFKKGDTVIVPICAIHYDEERWPEPEVFNPERFSLEAKKKIGPFDWMPFGYGPRNCIGMRLALLEIKIAVATLLRRVKLVPSSKTQVPLKFDKIGFKVKDGIYISAEARSTS